MDDLIFRPARPEDADAVYSLYRSLAGTPYCAWDETYPGREHIADDLAAEALCCLCEGADVVAAAAIRRWKEHDAYSFWSDGMKHPCDLMRFGVARRLQGQGIGRRFLRCLTKEAGRKGYDGMRILAAETNLPALALYRKAGAEKRGEVFSYGIHWECLELRWQI